MTSITALTLLLALQTGDADAQPGPASEPGGQAVAADGAQQANEVSEPQPAASEADTNEAVVTESGSSVFDTLDDILNTGAIGYLRQGGLFMWPILIMGILAAGVIIERYRSLKMLSTDSDEVRAKVLTLLQQEQVEDALRLCDDETGPVPAILSAGLRKYLILRKVTVDAARTEEQVVKAMDDYSVHIVAALEKHLPVLATVSSAAPMLGFLGTVAGMITSFADIESGFGETNIVLAAAAGIKVSLLTTCFGLIVGIPAFMAFNYFTGVINRFVLEVEESATQLIEAVTLQTAVRQQAARAAAAKRTASGQATAPKPQRAS